MVTLPIPCGAFLDAQPLTALLFYGQRGALRTVVCWECRCEDEDNFIHPASEERCMACGAARDEQPNALVSDVLRALDLSDPLYRLVAQAAEQVDPGMALPF